jgi:hypothetical protein
MPTDGYRHAGATGGVGPTELGTTGEVVYGSREFEKAVATEMRLRRDSGRPADRATVQRDLVNTGMVKTIDLTPNGTENLHERERRSAMTDEQRQKYDATEATWLRAEEAQGGRTLAEAQAIQSADHGARRSQSAGGRTVRLAEQTPDEAYEQTYNTRIAQGYSPFQARNAAEFVALEAKRLAAQRLPGAR